jgi:hypothetical protein
MLKALGSRLTYANVMATVAVFLALGGGAYALSGIPDGRGTFHGCVSNRTGALRVVKSASSCQKAKTVRRHGRRVRIPGESAIAWNQKGQPGSNGANGINGTNGANGATNLIVRSQTHNVSAGIFTVPCNPGERAVSGGVSRDTGSDMTGDTVTLTAPAIQGTTSRLAQPGETPNAWTTGMTTPTSAANWVFFAVCASP